MAMPNFARRYTVQEVLAFPSDGNRYELAYGELLVTPAPTMRHQVVVQQLYFALTDYLFPLGLRNTAFNIPADISWDDESLVQPDLFVTIPEELRGDWSRVQTLRLAIEVLSPSSSRADRVTKRTLYQEHQVATYWIIDADAALVEVWHPGDVGPAIVTDVLRWRVHPDAPELAIDLATFFASLP